MTRMANRLDIDVVLHGAAPDDPGRWAAAARSVDNLAVAGPSAKKFLDFGADWFFVGADLSAKPAASGMLEDLPNHARGFALFEIPDEADAAMPVSALITDGPACKSRPR